MYSKHSLKPHSLPIIQQRDVSMAGGQGRVLPPLLLPKVLLAKNNQQRK